MMNKNDWRLTNQINYLFQKTLIKKHYQPFRKGWEHEGQSLILCKPQIWLQNDNII